MSGPERERGGLPDAAGGGPPSTSVDVLAAQVRGGFFWTKEGDPVDPRWQEAADAFAALDALVARVTAAEDRAVCSGCGQDVDEGGGCNTPGCTTGEMIPASDLPSALENSMHYWRDALADINEYADEKRRETDSLRAALADARNALEDAHEFQCGCDRPGNPSACVAEPREAFEVLARLDGNQP